MKNEPRLRTVEKYKPPYPLNDFPSDFALNLGREIVYLLATRTTARLEGSDWEEIFANLIQAEWKPSNIGLDDIIKDQTAWGAKTVKNPKPSSAFKVRLISGRNSPVYSFGDSSVKDRDPNELGSKVLSIWNERVAGIRKLYRHVRTIVLVKSENLQELAVFEVETTVEDEARFRWQWNENNNLEGYDKLAEEHRFTWQPHGSQFTIIETVPKNRLALKVQRPPHIDHTKVLAELKFDPSWVQIIP